MRWDGVLAVSMAVPIAMGWAMTQPGPIMELGKSWTREMQRRDLDFGRNQNEEPRTCCDRGKALSRTK
jgi:hypothetical protein